MIRDGREQNEDSRRPGNGPAAEGQRKPGGRRGRKKSLTPVLVACGVVLCVVASVVVTLLLEKDAGKPAGGAAASGQPDEAASAGQADGAQGGNAPAVAPYGAAALPEEMRAMWISFIEWEGVDISTEANMRAVAGKMFDNSAALGMNTVIVAVRPFSDALYKSEIYPWSHVITGTQGQDPGYDPLAVLVEEAHARDLRIEAWINPYRVSGAANGPLELASTNPAVQHPDWVRNVGGVWYDPGLPEVQQMVADGVREIVKNYDVDGIHFDDYFYPEFSAEQRDAGEDKAFDEATFAKYGVGKELATWRRENVDTLVAAAYRAVKEEKPGVSFGISPQGNNDNNYNAQYSDVRNWMATPGFVDYVMPQLYWGFAYRTASGRDDYAFANVCATWAGFARDPSVKLYAGLGAYRIGAGDGGANGQSEWQSGHNLADMVAHLRAVNGFSGFAMFRYDFLFDPPEDIAAVSAAEGDALRALLVQPEEGEAPETA